MSITTNSMVAPETEQTVIEVPAEASIPEENITPQRAHEDDADDKQLPKPSIIASESS